MNLSTLTDRILGAVAPRLALRRESARIMLRDLRTTEERRLRYRAAETHRLREWNGVTDETDAELELDLPKLRERSREIVQNSPLAAGIIGTLVDNVVGSGFECVPSPRADRLDVDETALDKFRDRAKDLWEEWSEQADATARTDFSGLHRLLERSALEGGDVFFHLVSIEDKTRTFRTAIELLEAERVGSPVGDLEWRMGVKRDRFGAPTHFRVFGEGDQKWSGQFKTYPRLTAAGLVMDQYMIPLRPGQTRGIPIFAPALEFFDDLRGYVDAEITAARATACITAIVKRNGPAAAVPSRATRDAVTGKMIEELQPGQIEYLEPGEDIVPFNPQRPGMIFDAAVTSLVRMILRAVGLPFELGALDFSKANYSSSRASILEARRSFVVRQITQARRVLQPIYRAVLEEAWFQGRFKGIVKEPSWAANLAEWTRADWGFPGWGWVDPEKEINSSILAVKAGLSTRSIEAKKWAGRNWSDLLEAGVREEVKIRETRKRLLNEDPEPEPEPGGGGGLE
ncbi:MAG: phage portal protein [Candidatus Omnitrophica bacterium]|jgi:lambda family phage portal protein|nr:phage portal protein [Candidatus Omnitrophota bacterium]